MARVLLLNPPGDRTYLRDSYCSKASKAAYLTPPMDLLAISGYLPKRHEMSVLDAMAHRMPTGQALAAAAALAPGFVVSLIGLASLENDLGFLRQLKQGLPQARLAVSGDAGFGDTEGFLRENPFIDAVLMDYSSQAWLKALDADWTGAGDIAFLQDGVFQCRSSRPGREFSIGLPRHELFPYKKYRMPFARRLPYAGVATDFGCPFKCGFCLIGQMPFKLRPVPEVLGELEHLKRLGIKYFSFGDQTFGADRPRTETLLEGIRRKCIGLPWGCFFRADLLDEEYLESLRSAGCELLMIGVESGSQELLDRHHKGLHLEQVRRAFELCRRKGVRTVATFIVGLPGETRQSFEATVGLALDLEPDFASFNLPVAKPLTPLRREAEGQGWLSTKGGDQSQATNIFSGNLAPEKLMEWQTEAVRRFYLRPGYWARRLAGIGSPGELIINLREAWAMLGRGG